MTIEEQTMPAVLVQCFNDIADSYGIRRYDGTKKANPLALSRAVRWYKEVPALSPREFIAAQIRAVDESRLYSVTFSSLFKNKDACMHRLGADAEITAAGYADYLVYYCKLLLNPVL